MNVTVKRSSHGLWCEGHPFRGGAATAVRVGMDDVFYDAHLFQCNEDTSFNSDPG